MTTLAESPLHSWIYSSTLAYIVDANPGRSSAAVAANSCFRGVAAFAFTLAAVPLQDSVGDGALYTLWAGLLVLCELLFLLVQVRGGQWRMAAEEREKAKAQSCSRSASAVNVDGPPSAGGEANVHNQLKMKQLVPCND
jgi:threonine/homoserine/homoserine lactone efflux protein